MIIVLIIISAFLFSYFVSAIYRRLWCKNLEVDINFTEEAVVEGMKSELTETISNRKWMFLPIIQVTFETNRNLKFGQEENVSVSDLCYKRDMFSVGGYQKITRTVPFYCSKRGYYEINNADVISRTPLLTEKLHSTAKQNTHMYGYPKNIEDDRLDISFQKIMGEIQARKNIYEDPFEFRGIREYQPTDPMSKINWKASAKSEEWMVNLYGSTNAQEIHILLDLEKDATGKIEDIYEIGIRLAATLAERFMEADIPVALMTNAKDIKEDKSFHLEVGTGKQQLLNIKKGLARIDLSKKADSIKEYIFSQREKMDHAQKTYIMISTNLRAECYEAFTELTGQGASGFWMNVRYSDTQSSLPTDGRVKIIDWEVAQ